MNDRRLTFLLDEQVLRVEGEDARTWLQGQLTCDVGVAAPGRSTYGLILLTTGQVLSDVWVLDEGEALLLRLPAARAGATLARLEKYLVMEDVDLVPTSLRVLHTLEDPGEGVATPRLSETGFDLLVEDPSAALDRLRERGFSAMDEATWERLRVEAGRPRVGKDAGEATLPQEAGLLGAVHFAKGCFLGQEPVVMLRDRGKPPKRLVQLQLEAPTAEGSSVTNAAGESVGTVTSAAGHVALALVKRRALEAGPIFVAGHPPIALRVV